MNRCLAVAFAFAMALPATTALAQQGDILLVDRAAASQSLDGPKRGALMNQVQAQFGEPSQKMEPRGGQQPQWPTITRWVYPNFVVYFENNHVVDVVAQKASPGEIGPKPTK